MPAGIFWVLLLTAIVVPQPLLKLFFILWWAFYTFISMPRRSLLRRMEIDPEAIKHRYASVEASQVPEEAQAAISPHAGVIEDLGFTRIAWAQSHLFAAGSTYLALFLSEERRTLCSIIVSRPRESPAAVAYTPEIRLTSRPEEQTLLTTSNCNLCIGQPRHWNALNLPKTDDLALLYKVHRARCERIDEPLTAYPDQIEHLLELLSEDARRSEAEVLVYDAENRPVRMKRRSLLIGVYALITGWYLVTEMAQRLRTRAELRRLGFGRLA